MTRKEFIDYQQGFYHKAHKLMMRKNADYSTGAVEDAPAFANFEIVNSYPALEISPEEGAFIRLLDKISRLSRVMQPGYDTQINDEQVEDTCLDIANYVSIIAGMVNERNTIERKAHSCAI